MTLNKLNKTLHFKKKFNAHIRMCMPIVSPTNFTVIEHASIKTVLLFESCFYLISNVRTRASIRDVLQFEIVLLIQILRYFCRCAVIGLFSINNWPFVLRDIYETS